MRRAGYRMLGPIGAYDAATNKVMDLTLSTESKRDMLYLMASGTCWAHVMIER